MSEPAPDAKDVIARLKPLLKARGYTTKGQTFVRHSSEDNTLVVNVQKSRDPGPAKIALNYGVHSARVANWLQQTTPADDVWSAHWRKRCEADGRERWFVLAPGRSVDEVAAELSAAAEQALADLEAHQSDAALRDAWLAGASPGLSEFQRLLYAVILVKELGPAERLGEVVTSLRRYVDGKPMESAARRHLGALWPAD